MKKRSLFRFYTHGKKMLQECDKWNDANKLDGFHEMDTFLENCDQN